MPGSGQTASPPSGAGSEGGIVPGVTNVKCWVPIHLAPLLGEALCSHVKALAPRRANTIAASFMSSASQTPSTAKVASKKSSAPASYEQALDELERLVAAMESQQLPLEQLLESYKRGAELLGFCRNRLQAIEQQVKVLDGEGLRAREDS